MDGRLYWIWMQQALGAGSFRSDSLLRAFGDARSLYAASPKEMASAVPDGLSQAEGERLADKSMQAARRILTDALQDDGWILTPEDSLYPFLLRAIPGPPLALYGRGELPDLDLLPAIALVGTREPTAFGRRVTALLSGGLSLGGMVVVSGGARGIDTIAHEAALAAGGQTIAVQGCGLDVDYPPQNRELRRRIVRSGAIVSEFPPGMPPLRHHFPIRNRIISGLTLSTCVTEAPVRSGALITANYALHQGRDVFAVAGDMLSGRSEGTDSLIKQGAKLVRSAEEILEEYSQRFPDIIDAKAAQNIRRDPRFRPGVLGEPVVLKNRKGESSPPDSPVPPADSSGQGVCPEGASPAACTLFAQIGAQPASLDALIGGTGISAPQAMAALTELEMAGAIRCKPGQGYYRP